MGEDLIKPSITAFLKAVMGKDDNAVKAMPLSNITVSWGKDEISEDIETQLVEELKMFLTTNGGINSETQ